MEDNKILHVVRHAKSSWDLEGLSDIDRPLKAKGIKNAYQIANQLLNNKMVPDLIISSPANRALHTAVIFARAFRLPFKKLTIHSELYHSTAKEILRLVQQTDNEVKSLMIFGHNPDFTFIANYFLSEPIINLPTAGVATFIFNTDKWKNIDKSLVGKRFLTFPEKS